MDFDSKAERNAKIYARRVDGLSLPAIAREFNLARETVREIVRCMQRKAQWREYDAKLRVKDK
jgi:Mor family transcriptional regulator